MNEESLSWSWVTGAFLLCLSGCTVTHGVPAPDRYDQHDVDLAEQTAFIGRAPRDGFKPPPAQTVGDTPAQTPPGPSTPTSVAVGHARLVRGSRPAYASSPIAALQPTSESDAATSSKPGRRWRLARTIRVGEGYLYKAQFSADERSVITMSLDSGSVYHYDVTSGAQLHKLALPGFTRFESADFAVLKEILPRPSLLISRETGIAVLDLESGHFDVLKDLPAGNFIQQTGRLGLYASVFRHISPQSGELSLHWLSGESALTAHCDERPDDLSLSADGKWLALAFYPSGTAQLIDLETERLILEHPMPKYGGSVALSPDKTLLAVGGERLQLIRVADGQVIAEDASYKNNISDIQFSGLGDLLLVSAFDGHLRSYALPAGFSGPFSTPQLLDHKYLSNVYSFDLSSNDRLLVTPSGDQTLKIWSR